VEEETEMTPEQDRDDDDIDALEQGADYRYIGNGDDEITEVYPGKNLLQLL
jgi:hypothetical protein